MTTSSDRFIEIEHGRAGENLAERLRADILAGEFAPGTRIRQTDLAERYGATRAPVREALRMLTAEGLISSVANAGAWVSKLSLAECEELYRMRERLEPLLLEFTVPQLTDETRRELHSLAEQTLQSSTNEDFITFDRHFHMLTYRGVDTLVLTDTVRRLWDRTHHYRRAFVALTRGEDASEADHDHFLMAAAIGRGDAEEAGRVLQLHIRRTRLRLYDHPEIFE